MQLALLFIYRSKAINPTVKGRPGSGYGLLSVALMLSNKFPGDDIYTNQTWSKICGISVQEFHVMEVEFLSNMRYSLRVTPQAWSEWQGKLGILEKLIRTRSGVNVFNDDAPNIHFSASDVFMPILQFSNINTAFQFNEDGSNSSKPQQTRKASISEPKVLAGCPLSQITASKSGFPQAHSSADTMLTYETVGSPALRTITNLVGSPFESCSPRYHFSCSPNYYHSIISPSNTLYYLSPFPIKYSSPLANFIHERQRNSLDYQPKQYANVATPDGPINRKLKEKLASIVKLGLRLDWPALTEADGFGL